MLKQEENSEVHLQPGSSILKGQGRVVRVDSYCVENYVTFQ